jgi:hypothetical protein
VFAARFVLPNDFDMGRNPQHAICENFEAIDIRELQRRNSLRPGLCSILKWDDEVVILKSQPAAIVLISSVLPDGAAEPKYLLQRVPIHRTKCHLGGERPWFNCIVCTSGKPCGRRAAKLYRVGHLFACRHCWGLVYASQQEIPVRRAMRRARKIKMRLGGSDDPLEPLPQKPRGMHRRTYERLRAQADAADAEADALLVGSMPGLKSDSGVADPAPPRPKRQRRRRDGGK